MKTHPHRAVERLSSPSSLHAARRRGAAVGAILAVLMLGTSAAVAAPTPKQSEPAPLGAGAAATQVAEAWFDNAGTNPIFTGVTFSTLEYYDAAVTGLTSGGRILVRVKTAAQLNALASPPPNPFTVTAVTTMTNDEGATASGTLSFKTAWAKSVAVAPSGAIAITTTTAEAPPGVETSAFAEYFFKNAGAGAQFTAASFETMDCYDADRTGVDFGFLFVTAKTADELDASGFSSPCTVSVLLTVTNNQGQTGTGTVDFTTRW